MKLVNVGLVIYSSEKRRHIKKNRKKKRMLCLLDSLLSHGINKIWELTVYRTDVLRACQENKKKIVPEKFTSLALNDTKRAF